MTTNEPAERLRSVINGNRIRTSAEAEAALAVLDAALAAERRATVEPELVARVLHSMYHSHERLEPNDEDRASAAMFIRRLDAERDRSGPGFYDDPNAEGNDR